jgi:predicted nucleic acid-binding Zn ribbon protein
MATIQIPNHSHCVICSRAVPFGDKTCGDKCQADMDELDKKRKKSMYMMYALMALAFLVLALSYTGIFGGG